MANEGLFVGHTSGTNDKIANRGIKSCVEEFFSQNVCIPKEDIAHLEWIYNRMINVYKCDKNLDYMLKFASIIGIKPSEPVYLYRFTYQDYDGTVGISDYLSEKDAIISLVDVSNVSKLEWTKQVGNA